MWEQGATMAYIMIVNRSHFPIHGALSWGTMQTQCKNDLAPGASYDFVVGVGWTDLTVVTARKDGSNRFDPAHNNDPTRLFKLAGVVAAGIVGAIGGGGPAGAAAMTNLLLSKEDIARFSALGALPADAARGTVTLKAANIQMNPAMAIELYCPDGWTVIVSGNEVKSSFDSATSVLTIDSISPLYLHCENRNGNPNKDFQAPA